MRYGIGLDIGISSVGSCIIQLDEKNEPYKILKLYSRVYYKAEKSDGKSLATERRNNRSIRRVIRRKRHRKERIRTLICNRMNVDNSYIDRIFAFDKLTDIYMIRCEALDRLLDINEFIRLLIHFSQRRGFKSNRKAEAKNAEKESEDGVMLSAVKENHELMKEKGYRTIGEMIFRDQKFSGSIRNKGGSYSHTFLRSDYENEIHLIFRMQRAFLNQYADEEFENKYMEILMSQRSFDEGPGGGKYAGNQIEKMLRKCTFEPNEYRAPKASFSFQYFTLLSKINSIRIQTNSGRRYLSENERISIKKLAFDQKEINYSSLRKLLKLSDEETFNISYFLKTSSEKTSSKKKVPDVLTDFVKMRDKVETKTKFNFLKEYHVFKSVYGNEYDFWENDKKNKLAYVLTVYKTDEKIKAQLEALGFTEEEIAKAMTIQSFAKFGNLSCKAMDKMIPYLEEGYLYNEAADKAGYNFKADEKCASMYLPTRSYILPEHRKSVDQVCAPELDNIVNPVVRRAVSQTIKVVNAIIREMKDSPVYVNVEMARELSKSYNERLKIEKEQQKNKSRNDSVIDKLRSDFQIVSPTGQDIMKLKLWEDQQGLCMYSGRKIPVNRLFESGFTEVDHIVPYSISFDDSYNNKVLVLATENQNKSDRLPLQYLRDNKADEFRVRVETSSLNIRKKQNLLKEKITDEDYTGFKERNLKDTQYISRFMKNYIEKYLLFAEKPKVTAVNGAITSYIRKRWGIRKIRSDGDTHHAIDACVIACVTQGMIQKISVYSKYKEKGKKSQQFIEYTNTTGTLYDVDSSTGEIVDRFPMPYPTFRKELEMLTSKDPMKVLCESNLPNYTGNEQLTPIFVSRMVKHKVTGAAHKDTKQSLKKKDGKSFAVQKVDLANLKFDKKTGEIINYYNPQDDALLYAALIRRLKEFDGNAKKAFEEPFFKPKKDGSQGPLVKKVKIIEKSTLSVPLDNGNAIAGNDSMVRVDVFYINGEGYYLVPVYEVDTVKKILPNKAIVQNKSYEEWKIMSDENFVFSLYPNDLIAIKSNKKMTFSLDNKNSTLPEKYVSTFELVYYRNTGISTASINVINHDKTYVKKSLGVKNLMKIEKYSVDVLGNITKVGREKRRGF